MIEVVIRGIGSSDPAAFLRRAFARTPGVFEARMKEEVLPTWEDRLNDAVLVEPGPPSWPIGEFPWASETQRIAYFASDGFGGGIPHQRGDFAESFEGDSRWQGISGQLAIVGPGEATYIIGPDQQPFHAGRWKQASVELERIGPEFGRDMVRAYKTSFVQAIRTSGTQR